ncbi:MAG: VanZ family protein, partial [Anaerolineae bacterium]|nr:VanZ family protein [Anaerolineae bacterium]
TLWSAGLWALIYALLDEAHQRFVPGRWSSWRDWLADLAGILIAMILLVTWIRYESAIKGWWHAMRAHRSSRRGSRGRWAREGESSGSPNDQG